MKWIIIGLLVWGCSAKAGEDLKPGDRAPDFSLKDAGGREHSLSLYQGKTVALYFYPKDDTPGCTAEACNLRDNFATLKDKGVIVLGVSFDDEESHGKFGSKYALPFPLLADKEKKVAGLYNVAGLAFAKRVTFLIGPEGKIQHIFDKVETSRHAEQILEVLANPLK